MRRRGDRVNGNLKFGRRISSGSGSGSGAAAAVAEKKK